MVLTLSSSEIKTIIAGRFNVKDFEISFLVEGEESVNVREITVNVRNIDMNEVCNG